jgi:UDP:flavonoid glycosyltransferase YjiC (YdhE family)
MKVGLFPHCAFLSETSRMLAIGRALRARGVDVAVGTHGGPHEAVLAREGIEYTVLGPPMDAERCARFVHAVPGIGAPDQSFYTDEEMRAYVRAEADFIAEQRLDIAVTGFMLTLLLSTRLAGVPLAASHGGSYVPPLFERGLLPYPSRHPQPIMRFLPRPLARWLMNKGLARLRMHCAGFDRIAAEMGVETVPSFPALLLADLTLVTDLPEILGIPRDELESWTPGASKAYRATTRLRYTGPLYARLDLPLPDRVRSFLDAPGRTAYVAVTSTGEDLVRGVVKAVRAAGVRVLVASTVHRLADMADTDVLVEPILPSHVVMPLVDVAVTAGGQGSTQTAAASGVPLVGIALQPEQDLNIHLLERQGMAIRLSPRLAASAAMTDAVRTVLADPRYRANAERLRAIVGNVDGAGAAADAIIEFVAGWTREATPRTTR